MLQLEQGFERFSKGMAVIAFAIYFLGFLVVSLQSANYGYFDISPFKSKVITAGSLLVLLILIPCLTADYIFEKDLFAEESNLLSDINLFIFISSASINMLGTLFSKSTISFYDQADIASCLYLLILIINLIFFKNVRKLKENKKLYQFCFSFFSLFILLASIMQIENSIISRVLIFYCWVGFLYTFYIKQSLISGDKVTVFKNIKHSFYEFIAIFVFTISSFSTYIYPHISFAWGGGSPVPVTVLVKKDGLLDKNPTNAFLLNETPNGFYLLLEKEAAKTVYLPRDMIEIVYFEALSHENTKKE